MESDDANISIFITGPGDENKILDWRSAGPTPDDSPSSCQWSFFDADSFSDIGPNGILHSFENPALNESSCGTSTALNQQPGNIDLADHTKTVITYPHAFSPPQGDDRGGLACKVESSGDWDSLMNLNEAFSRSFDPLASARSDLTISTGRAYRPGQNMLLPIETSFRPGPLVDQPPSGISEQSTINSTPINSSSSENSCGRGIAWASPIREYAYPSHHQRKRSSSACGNPHLVGNHNRKRSSSDVYTTNDSGSARPPALISSDSSYLNIPMHSQYSHTTLWGPEWHSRSQSSMDLIDLAGQLRSGSSTVGLSSVGQAREPPWNYHRNQALAHSPVEDGSDTGQTLQGGANHFRAQVASEAVVNAARKKRKNHDGKVFLCDFCGRELTTKQNLQYHICAHLGKRDYLCSKCEKSFTTPHVRNRHETRCRSSDNVDF